MVVINVKKIVNPALTTIFHVENEEKAKLIEQQFILTHQQHCQSTCFLRTTEREGKYTVILCLGCLNAIAIRVVEKEKEGEKCE